jgi:lipopolysaccharide biosynthesis protein
VDQREKGPSSLRGHQQPVVPGELGYYSLLDPAVREAQCELARLAGVTSFCYWHYWFAGRELLERPLDEVLSSGRPDFPFFVGWANQSWSGVWHGAPQRILMEQTYPGDADDRAHFERLLPMFRDPRYVRRGGDRSC